MPSAVPAHDAPPKHAPPASMARRSVIITKNIFHNWRCKVRTSLGEYGSSIGSTHSAKSVTESLDYIDRVYRDYVFYGNLSEQDIADARVLEIGPGDNLGVALQFVAAGASQVVALDKFVSQRDEEHSAEVYRTLRNRLRGRARQNVESAITLGHGIHFNPARLQLIEGVATEDADRTLPNGVFSLIVSRAVLEEIHEIDRAFHAMDGLLAPGGRMVHKIDLGDYGTFSNHGLHPLEFLTIPSPVYTLMTEFSGQPNRRRIDYYRKKMRELGYFAGFLVTSIAGVSGEILPHKPVIDKGIDYDDASLKLIRSIRPRLARPFRKLPDEDLLVSGIFLIAQKPG